MATEPSSLITGRPQGLVDVLDRILDKGLVIAGDIKISIANVELLTVQIRLLICSIDKAEEIGLDWWRYDRNLSSSGEGGTRRLGDAAAGGETQRAGSRKRGRAVKRRRD